MMDSLMQGQINPLHTIQGEPEPPLLEAIVMVASAPKPGAPAHLLLRGISARRGTGYRVDAVEMDTENFRIMAKLAVHEFQMETQAAPDAPVEIDLGRPPSGSYVVELYVRSAGQLHRLQQAFVITIRTPRRLAPPTLGVGQDAGD